MQQTLFFRQYERKDMKMTDLFYPEGGLYTTVRNRRSLSSITAVEEAAAKGEILEAYASSCDSGHNLTVDLGYIKGIIPRCEGAVGIREGRVRDIALISRVGKAVSFVITGFSFDHSGNRIAVLSRRRAQERCISEYLSKLTCGEILSARVTHLENFGAFCDIGCGCAALLPIDSISVSRISHPSDRIACGDLIKAAVKSNENGRITLTMKELLGTWEENAGLFSQGSTVTGIIRSVESYGIFVELMPNLAGLAELKNGVGIGDRASVYIKSILPEKMKVKLIIIDSFPSGDEHIPLKYFNGGEKITRWVYSPEECARSIVTNFDSTR